MNRGLRIATAGAAVLFIVGVSACGNPDTVGSTSSTLAASTVTVTDTATAQPDTVTMTAQPTESTTALATDAGGKCTLADLSISLGEPSGAAGSVYYALTFTNTSFTTCTLEGFPQVAYVAGDDSKQVGGAAAENGDAGTTVTLKPGEHAAAALQEVDVLNFPEDVCTPTAVTGLRVTLPGGAADSDSAFVPQDNTTGCAAETLPGGQFQMSVQAISTKTP